MQHQKDGVLFMEERDLVAVVVDRGCGKTGTVMKSLEGKVASGLVNRILYVAPLSTLENICREARMFATNIVPQIIYGAKVKRIKMVEFPGRHNMDVINFDALRIIQPELLQAKYDTVILDESTRIKDKDTRTCRAATIIGSIAKTKILMTGMPFTEGVENAWSQFHFLDPSIVGDNYYAFRNRYCIMQSKEIWIKKKVKDRATGQWVMKAMKKTIYSISGYKKLDDLQEKIAPFTYRVAKEDCLDLPAKTYQVLTVPMLEQQAKRYAHVEKKTLSEIGSSTINHVAALSKLQKLRQVAAGFMYDSDHEAVTIPCSKYNELETLLGELYGNQKAVVFTSFRAEPEMVEAIADSMKNPVKVFRIPDNPMDRQGTIDTWGAYDGVAILVGNVISGGTGLNLTAAHMAIFLSNVWQMEPRVQAEDRVHRIGSDIHKKIIIVDIVTEGTIEEDILVSLKKKRDLVEVFLERMKKKGGRS